MAKDTHILVTPEQYAKHFGVSVDTVYKWLQLHRLQVVPMYDQHLKHARWWIVFPQRRPKKTVGRPPLHSIEREKLPPVSRCTSKAGHCKVSSLSDSAK